VVSAVRTPEAQQALYTSGAGVTNAPALMSYHNHGLAFDVVPEEYLPLPEWNPEGVYWEAIGAIGKSVGLEWGGDWKKKDRPHFQLTAAPIGELKAYYEKFKAWMPVKIEPTAGGAIIALLIVAFIGWYFRKEL
jgi:hypothetical protein